MKSVRISEIFWSAFSRIGLNTERYSVFNPNAGKYGPEKLRIRALFHAVRSLSGYFVKLLYLITCSVSPDDILSNLTWSKVLAES